MQETGADEIVTSNIVNQILYPALFFLSFIAFISNADNVFDIIRNEKALVILLTYALISILWSAYPIVSIKRWYQIFTYYFVIVVFLSYIKTKYELIKIIKPILFTYILISIIAVFIVPGAKDPGFGTWRGLASTKNQLGQISLISIVMSLIIFKNETKKYSKYIIATFFLISLSLAIGSVSSTTYTALAVFLLVSIIIYLKAQIFDRIGVSYFLSIMLLLVVFLVAIILLYVEPQVLDLFQGLFGKEGSFADRARLWEVILLNASQHLYLGGGFQGFWVIDSPTIQLLYTHFLWLPIQSHNGYIDILNDLGIIGLSLFIFIIINYFIHTIKNKKINLWTWFIVLPLIINLTETTLFRTGHITFIFFILGYLLVYANLIPVKTKLH
jgi:O-antigen ligase